MIQDSVNQTSTNIIGLHIGANHFWVSPVQNSQESGKSNGVHVQINAPAGFVTMIRINSGTFTKWSAK